MKPSDDNALLDIVKTTGEIYGKQVSLAAALMFLADLDQYDSVSVISALSKCRKELRSFPSVADVIARIDDGRPGVEEAWAMLPKHEADSVVWSSEMAEAYGLARWLIDQDPVAARMAFKEAYCRSVASSRANGIPVQWSASLGHDSQWRAAVLVEAVNKSRLSLEHAKRLDPQVEFKQAGSLGLGFSVAKLLQEMPA